MIAPSVDELPMLQFVAEPSNHDNTASSGKSIQELVALVIETPERSKPVPVPEPCLIAVPTSVNVTVSKVKLPTFPLW